MGARAAGVRRTVLVWLVAVAAVALWPRPAFACSCAMLPPDEALAMADAAFVGALVGRDGDRWTFDVEAVMGGELSQPLTIRAEPGDGANCGLTLEPGSRVGLLLYREADGSLTSNGCNLQDADALLKAGQPRPPTALPSDEPAGVDAASDGGWGVVAATVLGAAAVLGGAVVWGRRTT